MYGKQYDARTAGTDLGVPLMLEGDINKQEARATVAQVYERIFEDLNEALTLLTEDMPRYAHIPGRAAAMHSGQGYGSGNRTTTKRMRMLWKP